MDIDELQSVQSRERQTDSLQQLRESFYREASEYIQQLRDDRDRAAERADDPWDDPEVSRLSDEIDTAEQAVEAIYDRRTGKVVKKASLAAAGMPADEDGLTREERELFETLVADIEANREHVLDMIAGDLPEQAAEGPDAASVDDTTDVDSAARPSDQTTAGEPTATPEADDGVSAADVMGASEPPAGAESDPDPEPPTGSPGSQASEGKAGPPAGTSETSDRPTPPEERPPAEPDTEGSDGAATDASAKDAVDRETVRITADVGEILGVDQRSYDLGRNDVVQLPTDNVGPLIERDAAERLD
jgi:DNA replication factor GINS